MSRFNTASVGTKTVNLAGGEAFKETPKLELASILLTSFAKDQHYRTGDDTFARIRALVSDKSIHKFAAKAAIYARTKFGMRSITHVLAAELAKVCKGEKWTKHFYAAVVHRPDDATEILSYYMANFKKPIPNSLKKGLGMAISKVNAYSLAKYRGEGKSIKMIDAVNLVHPKANEHLTQLVKGELKSTETWESKLSKAGQDAGSDDEKEVLKKGAWEELLKEKKLGYFALLRNLWNIHEQAKDSLPLALEQLLNKEAIKKSLVLPFRFKTAIDELGTRNVDKRVIVALSKALDISVDNVPHLEGKTLVALDVSGSMSSIHGIASLFAAVLFKSNDCEMMTFEGDAKYLTPNAADSVTSIAASLKFDGGSTNFHSIFQRAKKKYDRIVILSDMQAWDGGYQSPANYFVKYKTAFSANPFVYSWDLAGYGTMQFPERNVFALAGFSEKVFDVMAMVEIDKNAMINEIEKVEL